MEGDFIMNSAAPEGALKIGAVVNDCDALRMIQTLKETNIQSITINFTQNPRPREAQRLADSVSSALADSSITISCLAMYELSQSASSPRTSLRNWYRLIDAAPAFGADLVAGIPAWINSTNIEAALIQHKRLVTSLAEYAAQRGVRLAFRNSAKADNWFSGGWNIRQGSSALDLLMQEINLPNVGIDLELVHELTDAIDPLRPVERWRDRVFHVFWKDDIIYDNVLHKKQLWDFSEQTPEKRMSSSLEHKTWEIVKGLNSAHYEGALDFAQESMAA